MNTSAKLRAMICYMNPPATHIPRPLHSQRAQFAACAATHTTEPVHVFVGYMYTLCVAHVGFFHTEAIRARGGLREGEKRRERDYVHMGGVRELRLRCESGARLTGWVSLRELVENACAGKGVYPWSVFWEFMWNDISPRADVHLRISFRDCLKPHMCLSGTHHAACVYEFRRTTIHLTSAIHLSPRFTHAFTDNIRAIPSITPSPSPLRRNPCANIPTAQWSPETRARICIDAEGAKRHVTCACGMHGVAVCLQAFGHAWGREKGGAWGGDVRLGRAFFGCMVLAV